MMVQIAGVIQMLVPHISQKYLEYFEKELHGYTGCNSTKKKRVRARNLAYKRLTYF